MSGLQAADILPLLKEKIAFLPGKACPGSHTHSWAKPTVFSYIHIAAFFCRVNVTCQPCMATDCAVVAGSVGLLLLVYCGCAVAVLLWVTSFTTEHCTDVKLLLLGGR